MGCRSGRSPQRSCSRTPWWRLLICSCHMQSGVRGCCCTLGDFCCYMKAGILEVAVINPLFPGHQVSVYLRVCYFTLAVYWAALGSTATVSWAFFTSAKFTFALGMCLWKQTILVVSCTDVDVNIIELNQSTMSCCCGVRLSVAVYDITTAHSLNTSNLIIVFLMFYLGS